MGPQFRNSLCNVVSTLAGSGSHCDILAKVASYHTAATNLSRGEQQLGKKAGRFQKGLCLHACCIVRAVGFSMRYRTLKTRDYVMNGFPALGDSPQKYARKMYAVWTRPLPILAHHSGFLIEPQLPGSSKCNFRKFEAGSQLTRRLDPSSYS